MEIIGKLISILSGICYIIILVFLVIVAPMVAGYRSEVVLTGSMEPTYKVGSVIYYKPASFEEINIGDVVTYDLNDDTKAVVTHRVIDKDILTKSFITQGDANETPDASSIAYSNVVGKVGLYSINFVGYFVRYVQNIFIIGAMFLILVADFLYRNLEESEEKTSPSNSF